jgi:hypothetical protein
MAEPGPAILTSTVPRAMAGSGLDMPDLSGLSGVFRGCSQIRIYNAPCVLSTIDTQRKEKPGSRLPGL